MARMYGNDEGPGRDFGDISQLTNLILDSGSTCHMMPQVLYLIPVSIEATGKHVEVADEHHVVEK